MGARAQVRAVDVSSARLSRVRYLQRAIFSGTRAFFMTELRWLAVYSVVRDAARGGRGGRPAH